MELAVVNAAGKATSKKVKLDATVFGIEPNDHAIYLDVKQYLANQRQGTHKAKERGEIKGSTRKIRKQKGSGAARVGSIKNPLFKGGGRIFGPKPRDYHFKLNKKVKSLARMSALTYRAKDEAILVVEDLKMDSPATKNYISFLKNVGADKKSVYVSGAEADKNVALSARNVPNAKITAIDKLNTYDILDCTKLILTESSLAYFKK